MSSNRTIRLALADDQSLVRHGLRALLSTFKDIDICVEADCGRSLLASLSEHQVDIILSDIRMPQMDGLELTRQLRQLSNTTPIILLTTFDDHELPLLAAEAGAQGFLLKDATPEDLYSAIIRVAAGETLWSPVATDNIRARYSYHESSQPVANFTDREISILRLISGGYSNREIAKTIHLSEGTVKNYVSDILDKLGTRDRTRAVLKAITLRVI